MIPKNAETEDCIFESLCDSLGIQRNFKEDMRSYIRKKKEKEPGYVDEIKLGESSGEFITPCLNRMPTIKNNTPT